MKDGFIKLAAVTPPIRVADCTYNAEQIIQSAKQAAQRGAALIVFPELCLTGYTCGDLFLQQVLCQGAWDALCTVRMQTGALEAIVVVGLPVRVGGALYNCAAVLHAGKVLGLVPKHCIPNYAEFYEARYFAAGSEASETTVRLHSETYGLEEIAFLPYAVFACKQQPLLTFGIEICEDLWVSSPPSVQLAHAGAHILLNLSASDELIGKEDYRRDLVKQQSGRLLAAYVYADAGFGESTQDMVFAGHNLIAENGVLLAQSALFSGQTIYADVDLERLAHERQRMNTFAMGKTSVPIRTISFSLTPRMCDLCDRSFSPLPFVPAQSEYRNRRCAQILTMQAVGLATRLRHTRTECAVLGLSGGLDSALALLVTVRAFDRLGLARTGIIAVTMPCFGTTTRTRSNAEKLAQAYGVRCKTVDITAATLQHFSDIGHDPADLSITFENGQARMRTLVLMDLANKVGGLVIGTGDLSELALGWATYNGDHMSMYGVNASIPKTLVRHLVAYEADHADERLSAVLRDIIDTPVSPELLPPKEGEISQKSEHLVGPYELHDFFLYHMLRFGASPRKIFREACKAFADKYDANTIKQWLTVFVKRFFAQQFKRSCLPDGPKVGTVTLSPRGDWRMPSDACASLWLAQLEEE